MLEILVMILLFPGVVLWELMKMNDKPPRRGRRRR